MSPDQVAPMRVAVTGGTGFVGGHLAARLSQQGHQVVLLARGVDQRPLARQVLRLPNTTLARVGIGDADGLARAFAGCQAVAHCAGINRQRGRQTYQAVHVQGTANVVGAAERAGVRRLALLSFLRAPIGVHYLLAWLAERLMTVPLISVAQVRILAEEVVEPALAPDSLPADLVPSTPFDQHPIRAGLPGPGPFQLADLRCWARWQHSVG